MYMLPEKGIDSILNEQTYEHYVIECSIPRTRQENLK